MYFSDKKLIEEIKKKNPETLEYILDTYGKRVYKLVYRIIGDIGTNRDIEDCVSDIFVFFWNNIGQYDEGRGNLRTWFFMIAKYNAFEYGEKLKKKTDSYKDDRPQIERSDEEEDDMGGISMPEGVENIIIQVIHEMTDLDRHIFMRRYFYYESIESIASSFEFPGQMIEDRLSSGRKMIWDRLFKDREDERNEH